MVIIKLFMLLILISATVITGYMSYIFFKDSIVDWKIYKKGKKCNGICQGVIQRGRDYYLKVAWIYENKPYFAEIQEISKFRKFPYNVTIYFNDNKSNLGIYSIIYDVLYFFICFFITIISLLGFLYHTF